MGILDKDFPECLFFKTFEDFLESIHNLKGSSQEIDYISICSPNHQHFNHIAASLRLGCHVICEKPLVPSYNHIIKLQNLEQLSEKKVYNILQLRHHPSILELKKTIQQSTNQKKYDVELTYITSRGDWYLKSWKGQVKQSFGIATNIGIHFFDMLHFIFGNIQRHTLHTYNDLTASGYIELDKAKVRWFLSIDRNQLPKDAKEKKQATYRSITCDQMTLEFSHGFTDLHTVSYEHILSQKGFGLNEAATSIKLTEDIRTMPLSKPNKNTSHPFLTVY